MKTKYVYYPDGKVRFKDIYKDGKLIKHYFYALEPKHHKYLEVHYNDEGKIKKYIKHKYPKGYYEYLVLLDNGYLKDKLYDTSPYCKYITGEKNGEHFLTVHRYNLLNGKFVKRSSEYIVRGKIMREKFYKNGKLIEDKKYKDGKPIKLYKSKKDQPKISERP